LRGNKLGYHWECLVGFNLDQLKNHIERKFIKGMSWDNMGDWHIDHIIPIAAFNFETADDSDFRRCWSLKNLQPLWAADNSRKRDIVERPFQPSLAREDRRKSIKHQKTQTGTALLDIVNQYLDDARRFHRQDCPSDPLGP